jgi:hypothetical protein
MTSTVSLSSQERFVQIYTMLPSGFDQPRQSVCGTIFCARLQHDFALQHSDNIHAKMSAVPRFVSERRNKDIWIHTQANTTQSCKLLAAEFPVKSQWPINCGCLVSCIVRPMCVPQFLVLSTQCRAVFREAADCVSKGMDEDEIICMCCVKMK